MIHPLKLQFQECYSFSLRNRFNTLNGQLIIRQTKKIISSIDLLQKYSKLNNKLCPGIDPYLFMLSISQSVRIAMWMWFSQLVWRFHIPISIQNAIYFVRRSVSHATKYKYKKKQPINIFSVFVLNYKDKKPGE